MGLSVYKKSDQRECGGLMQADGEIQRIVQEISDYIADHPDAKDSLEGITKWWLARQQYENSLNKVQQALDYLEKNNIVKKSSIAGGIAVYSKTK